MNLKIAVAPLALLALSAPVHAQVAKSAPVAVQLPDETPVPVDAAWPGGTIDLKIDATDNRRGLYKVTETIPLAPGTDSVTLLFPEWLPGNHAARGPIALLSNIHFLADGKPVSWKRDPLDVYAFTVPVPKGTKNLVAQFVHTSPVTGSEGRITMTQEMLNLQWEKMSLYPAGHYTRKIAIKPTVTFPKDWTVFTALDGQTTAAKAVGNTVTWAATDYETLVDSPVFAGVNAKSWDIGQNVRLDAVADKPAQLALAPQNLQSFKNLIAEADTLFGARHFDHYDMLLALTDRMGGIGLEHHRSAENQFEPDAFTKWDDMDWDHNVVAHELVHSWNGKYRRPADLWTPDYRTPMQDSLLWVYEGQTQFWGWVLAARSGIQSKDTILGTIARAAAYYSEGQPGREWRDVGDTTNDPIVNARRPTPYPSLQRSEDYYTEGALTWLEADQIIRKGTNGAKGLDDFAKAFFGMRNGDWGELTYTFDDVVQTLNGVYPYDWAGFLTDRLLTPNRPPALRGIEAAGYRLVWRDTPNPFDKGRMDSSKSLDLTYSLGVSLNKDGEVSSTLWDGPAFDAGIVNGAKIVAVNGEAYSTDGMKSAITAAAGTKDPIQLLVKRGDTYATIPIDYHAGLRFPWLAATGTGEQPLDRLLAPHAGQ